MKKIILIALLLLTFSGIIISQTLDNPTIPKDLISNISSHETLVGDTLMHGQKFGNPVIPNQLAGNHHQKNGNTNLGASFSDTLCGLNYVKGSVLIETRYNSYTTTGTLGSGFPANITISGLSPCNIIKAFIYYDVSYVSGDDSTAQVVSLTNPNAVTNNYTSSNIGSSIAKCWGELGTWGFRVDVTGAISGNGVYTINSISGLTTPNWSVDGATLLIMYRDPAATYMGNMYLADGCWTVDGGSMSYTLGGFNTCDTPSYAHEFSIVADMQDNVASNHLTIFDNINYGSTTSGFRNSFYNFDDTLVPITYAQTTSICGYNTGGDCYCWILTGLYYQTTCTTCTPDTSHLTLSPSSNPAFCDSANGSAFVVASGGTAPYTYVWNTIPVQTTQTATGLSAGLYSVTVTDSTGCNIGVDTVRVDSTSSVMVSFMHNSLACYGLDTGWIIADTSGGTGPFTYTWSPNGGNGLTASNLTAATYTFTITDAHGCVQADTVSVPSPPQLTINTTNLQNVLCYGGNTGTDTVSVTGGTPGYTYLWSPIGQTTATATGLTPGNYTVLVTDSHGCTAFSPIVIITEPPPLTTTQNQVNELCFGGSNASAWVIPAGGTPAYHYVWSPTGGNGATASGLAAGTYSVLVTDANGCTLLETYTITQPTQLDITPTPSSQVICATFPATIGVNSSGGTPGYTYLWSNANTSSSQSVTPLTTTIYSVTVTDANGCTSVTHDTVTVTQLPVVTATSSAVCWGDSSTLTATGGPTYHWSNGATTQSITVLDTVTTYYTVYVTANGCQSLTVTDSAVILGNKITASFTSDSVKGYMALIVNFRNNSTGAPYYSWNFGDTFSTSPFNLDTSNLQNPQHTYDSAGNYIVTLIVYNQWGCSDTATENITVEKKSHFNVYNVFTPNGDGKNDLWIPDYFNITSAHVIIFNRWGEKIKDWTTLTGWDGTTSGGSMCPDGTYYYIINATGVDGVIYNTHGYLELIRSK